MSPSTALDAGERPFDRGFAGGAEPPARATGQAQRRTVGEQRHRHVRVAVEAVLALQKAYEYLVGIETPRAGENPDEP